MNKYIALLFFILLFNVVAVKAKTDSSSTKNEHKRQYTYDSISTNPLF